MNDQRRSQALLPSTTQWLHGILGTRWSGLSANCCFKLKDTHFSELKVHPKHLHVHTHILSIQDVLLLHLIKCAKLYGSLANVILVCCQNILRSSIGTKSNIMLQNSYQIRLFFSNFFNSVEFATNPNLSYWLLRLVMNHEKNNFQGSFRFLQYTFRGHAWRILNKLQANPFQSRRNAREANAKKQLICRADTGNYEIDGNCLWRALNYTQISNKFASPLKANRMLSLFLGRSIYFETKLNKADRPRLCAEVSFTH